MPDIDQNTAAAVARVREGADMTDVTQTLGAGRETCACGHIACVCGTLRRHKEDCRFLVSMRCPVGVECKHGYDVCPECDPCTCGVGIAMEDFGS